MSTTGFGPSSPKIASDQKMASKQNGPTNGRSKASFSDLSEILASLQTMRNGDFSVRLPGTWTGLPGKIADTFNEIVTANQQMAQELKRVGQVVGKEGKTRERTRFQESRGSWGEMEVSVNTLVEDLLRPTAEVEPSNRSGRSRQLDPDGSSGRGRPSPGRQISMANIANTMIQQLGVFTAEVTRVAREVGTDGKLGGQALVPGVAATWKDLTDSVNSMASNLTGQVRNIAEVATAVASGDLSRETTVDVRVAKSCIQAADQHHGGPVAIHPHRKVTARRARSDRSRLGGQASSTALQGTWKI